MQVKWTNNAAADFQYWQQHDPKKLVRIRALIQDIQHHPFSGLGKPEPLKYALRGKWSRRLTQEHRLVYEIVDTTLIILACRFHYTSAGGTLP